MFLQIIESWAVEPYLIDSISDQDLVSSYWNILPQQQSSSGFQKYISDASLKIYCNDSKGDQTVYFESFQPHLAAVLSGYYVRRLLLDRPIDVDGPFVLSNNKQTPVNNVKKKYIYSHITNDFTFTLDEKHLVIIDSNQNAKFIPLYLYYSKDGKWRIDEIPDGDVCIAYIDYLGEDYYASDIETSTEWTYIDSTQESGWVRDIGLMYHIYAFREYGILDNV